MGALIRYASHAVGRGCRSLAYVVDSMYIFLTDWG